MRCYQCNSIEDKNCASSDPNNLRQYSKVCPLLTHGTLSGSEPIACRKIIQNIEEISNAVIRECAYSGDKHVDGYRKQGNKAVKLLYYQCENADGNTPCNGASSNFAWIMSWLMLSSIIAMLNNL